MCTTKVRKTDAAEQLQSLLDDESDFIDGIIGKISHIKLLKETVDRKKREMEATQSQSLENRLTRMQKQVEQLQTVRSSSRPSHNLASIWTAPVEHLKPANLEIAPFGRDLPCWQEFCDMNEAAVDRSDYAPVDKLNYLKSKLTGEALKAISGYQLTNENYSVVVDTLKQRYGNKQG